MSRRIARDYAYRMIFSYLFKREIDWDGVEEIVGAENLNAKDADYLRRVLTQTQDHFDELSMLIASHARNFRLERIFKPDLAALYLACAEMCYLSDIPKSVSISEAIELVKQYSTDQSFSFVNGVLAGVYRQLEQKE